MPTEIRSPIRRRWTERNHPAYLMVSLFLLILIQPAFDGKPIANLVLNVLLSVTLLSAMLTVLQSRRILVAVCSIGGLTMLLNWLNSFLDLGRGLSLLGIAMLGVFAAVVIGIMLEHLLTARHVTTNTLCRAVSTYILIGIAWAAIYKVVLMLDPGAISGLTPEGPWGDFVYYSFTVLTTLGFGDVTPVSPYGKSLTILQAVLGPLYLTVLVAKLVAMHKPPDPKNSNPA